MSVHLIEISVIRLALLGPAPAIALLGEARQGLCLVLGVNQLNR